MTASITPNVVVGMPSQAFTMPTKFASVFNGKIYLGEIDKDPTIPSNQIPVYVEGEDGSYTQVEQPLKTNAAGFVVYNGSPAKFVTEKGYSMKVTDSLGGQIWYFPNILKYDPDQLRSQLEGSVISPSGIPYGSLTPSLEYFGATGDGVSFDDAAFDSAAAWLSGGNYRGVTSDYGKIYRLSRSHNFNLNNGRGHSFVMNSPIRPDAGTGTAITIQNTRDSMFVLRVDGGGDADVDYAKSDPSGAQQAFLIRGTRNCKADVWGVNYKGRVLRTMGLDAATGGTIKQSFFSLNIRTGDSTAVSPGKCYQAFYLQGDNSAWGKLETAWINWDEYGSVVEKVADITVGNIEFGASGKSGFEFRGIASAHIGVLAGGDETKTNTVLLFRPADDGTQCISVTVDKIFTLQGLKGVEFRGSNGANSGTDPNFIVGTIQSEGNSDAGVVLNGCNNSDFQRINSRNNNVNVRFERVTRNVRVGIDSLGSVSSGIVSASGANLDEVYVNGRVFGNAGSPAVDIANASVGNVTFNDMWVTSGNGAYNLPVSNLAKIKGGRVSLTSGGMFNTGRAKVIKDVEGYVTRNKGSGSISVGVQTVTVQHGLASTPTEITINPLSTAAAYRLLNINANSFDVRLSAPAAGEAYTFNWSASCEYQ